MKTKRTRRRKRKTHKSHGRSRRLSCRCGKHTKSNDQSWIQPKHGWSSHSMSRVIVRTLIDVRSSGRSPSLHTIELQLVMHHCDARTILRLARCSRALLAAASCDFAFRFAAPVPVPLSAGVSSQVSRSLVRFCALSLCEPRSQDADADDGVQIALRLLLSADLFPRVREIHLISATTSAEWDALLQHPSLFGLTSLCARGDGFVESHMRLLTVGHTQRRTLRFSSVVPQTVSGLLCKLPLLTDVAVAPCWSR